MAAVRTDQPVEERRFFELDILRGLAAYLVVIFHYKHFLLDAGNFDYTRLPFPTLLAPVYVYGQYFVELFFSISGYVFFWLYARALAERKLGLKSFFIARFSRLYPLFFVTFIAVAIIQWAFQAIYHTPYIYTHNTPGQFALNLFMIHQWVPHAFQTFNGPSWSISVEVFLYLLFVLLSYMRLNTPMMVVAVIAAGLIFKYMVVDVTSDFARGVPSFFFGGLAWYVVQFLRGNGREVWLKRIDTVLKWSLPVLWLLTYVRTQPVLWNPLEAAINQMIGVQHQTGLVRATNTLSVEAFAYLLIPLTLVALGLRQDRWRNRWFSTDNLHRFAWIGDISYSLYLIHFPLQIAVMILLAHWQYESRAVVLASPLFFIAFLGGATWLARLSYRYFEMPARKWLKTWLTQRLSPRPAPVVT